LTPGILPSAPSGPAPLFAPLLPRSTRVKKEVTKKESTWRGAPGLTHADSELLRRWHLRVRRGSVRAQDAVRHEVVI